MKRIILIFIIVFLYYNVKSQENADCGNPIILTDTVYKHSNAPSGFGKQMEIKSDKHSLYYFEKEHNVVWYKFNSPYKSILSLEIIPEQIKDDYDFLIFKTTGIKDICKQIAEKKLKPIRSNISRNDIKYNSITGLSQSADKNYVRSGPGEQFSASIETEKNEEFYIVLDNVYNGGKGHILKLHFNEIKIHQRTEIVEEKIDKEIEKDKVNINVIDKESGTKISALIEIFNASSKTYKKPIFKKDSTDNFSFKPNTGSSYLILISAKNYLNYSNKFKYKPSDKNIEIKAELEKISEGKNFKLENIYFFGNSAKFLPHSEPVLQSLLNFMKKNPSVKIEIQGHVNYPNISKVQKEQQKFNQQLSEDRAKAVYEYLVINNIIAERISYKGYSNSKMLYPNTSKPKEQEQNRRVEILITSY